MNDLIRVSTSSMSRDIRILEEQIAVLPDVISELKTQMNLLSGCWLGPAWVAFQNQVADDLGNMSDVYRFLSAFTKGMSESAEGYLDAEKRNHSEIWRLWI